jgi:hypothetical protein
VVQETQYKMRHDGAKNRTQHSKKKQPQQMENFLALRQQTTIPKVELFAVLNELQSVFKNTAPNALDALDALDASDNLQNLKQLLNNDVFFDLATRGLELALESESESNAATSTPSVGQHPENKRALFYYRPNNLQGHLVFLPISGGFENQVFEAKVFDINSLGDDFFNLFAKVTLIQLPKFI